MKFFCLIFLVCSAVMASEINSSFEALKRIDESQSLPLTKIFAKEDLRDVDCRQKEQVSNILLQARNNTEINKLFLNIDKQQFKVNYLKYINNEKIILRDEDRVDRKVSFVNNIFYIIDSYHIRDKKTFVVNHNQKERIHPFICMVDVDVNHVFLVPYAINDLTTKDFAVLRMVAGLHQIANEKHVDVDQIDVASSLLWHKIAECSEHINKSEVENMINKTRKLANLERLYRNKQPWVHCIFNL